MQNFFIHVTGLIKNMGVLVNELVKIKIIVILDLQTLLFNQNVD